ncbi:alpha/beta fold hydrolase [Priestia megaterium]|uniref:alpha/beta fold hydrolase n=2 Tax=Priestia megaterium TaxID=1404 RepID=UPI001F2F8FFF|nr:alpha/beta hydrolase [Priestia megaterium]MDN4634614.1 alpha/beta hydrolase [Sphingomonas sp. PsM26]
MVAADMPGYNLSDKPEEISSYSMPHLMEDVKQLIEAFAYTYPQYVKKLVMFDAPHPYTFIRELAENPAQREASSYMSFFQQSNSQDELLANNSEKLRNMLTEPGIKKGYLTKEEAKYVEAWNQPNAMKSMLNYYRASSLYPFEERVRKPVALPHKVFQSPTLIVWGNADEAFENSNLDGIEEYVPNVTIHRLDGVGHAPQHEQPQKVNEFMRDFLSK